MTTTSSKLKKSLIALLLTCATLFTTMAPMTPIFAEGEEDWLAGWTEVNQIGLFASANEMLYTTKSNDGSADFISIADYAVPTSFTVQYQFTDEYGMITSDTTAQWYMIDTEGWGDNFPSEYGYIPVDSVIIPGEDGETVLVSDVTTGNETVAMAVSGNIPEDATLNITTKTVDELENFTATVGSVALVLDVTVLNADGSEWQPAEGENLTVTLPAAAIGADSNDGIFVYHIHNGETELLGPYGTDGITVSFTIDGFSEIVYSVEEDAAIEVYGSLNKDEVTLYQNPVQSPETTQTVTSEQLPDLYQILFQVVIEEELWYFVDFPSEIANGCFYIKAADMTLNTSSSVSVSDIPDGTDVNWSLLGSGSLSVVSDAIVDYSMFKNIHNVNLFGFDIALYEGDDKYQPYKNEKTATVTITNVWDTSWTFPIVDVYHIIEDEEAINSNNILWSDDAQLVELYEESAVDGKVPYELISTRNGLVTLCDDGGITFEASSFSDYYVTSSDGTAITIEGSNKPNQSTALTYNLYMTVGSSASLTINGSINGNINQNGNTSYVSWTGSKQSYTISILNNFSENGLSSTTAASTISFQLESGNHIYNPKINVFVVSEEDIKTLQFTKNTIDHIQINVATIAIMVDGEEVETLTDINLGFTQKIANKSGAADSDTYKLVRVEDPDSKVGYYYSYTYTSAANIETTITIRIDESKDYGVDLDDLTFEITDVTLEENRNDSTSSSTGNQISFDGTFPVGMLNNQIDYIITVETTYNGTQSETFKNKPITFSDTIGYWDIDNVCPGTGYKESNTGDITHNSSWTSGGVDDGSGIDVAKFSAGYKAADGTYSYVIFSNLMKTVNGYTFGSTIDSRNYVFTIYRRTSATDSTDAGEWSAVDQITLTVNNSDVVGNYYTASTTLSTDASKYFDSDGKNCIEGYDYKIVETGYNINGYSCETSFSIDGTTVSGDSAEFVWNWTKTYQYSTSSSDSTVTYKIVEAKDGTTIKTVTTVNSTATTVIRHSSDNNAYSKTVDGTTAVITEDEKSTLDSLVSTDETKDWTTSVVYYTELSCSNTYEKLKSGLTIEKELIDSNGKTVSSSDYFQVIITPKELSSINGVSDFNGKPFTYTIDGSGSYSVTATSPNSGYGSLTVYIKAGEVINFAGLPVGTYTIQETGDCYYTGRDGTGKVIDRETTTNGATTSAKYTYDSTTHTKVLSSTDMGAKVTLKNTSTAPTVYSLTIRKEVTDGKVYDEDDTFIFDVKVTSGNETTTLTVTLKNGESVTIENIPAGSTYTVTERSNWRYEQTYDGNRTGTLNENKTTTVTNHLTNSNYFSDTAVATNQFKLNTETTETVTVQKVQKENNVWVPVKTDDETGNATDDNT